jgi:hypothetical protein
VHEGEVVGEGEHELESLVHLAPGTEVARTGPRAFELANAGARVRIEFRNADVTVEQAWSSSEFGVREQAPRLVARRRGTLPASFGYAISTGEARGVVHEHAAAAAAAS